MCLEYLKVKYCWPDLLSVCDRWAAGASCGAGPPWAGCFVCSSRAAWGLPALCPGPATSWWHDFPSLIPFPHLEDDNNIVTELLQRAPATLPVKSLPFSFNGVMSSAGYKAVHVSDWFLVIFFHLYSYREHFTELQNLTFRDYLDWIDHLWYQCFLYLTADQSPLEELWKVPGSRPHLWLNP